MKLTNEKHRDDTIHRLARVEGQLRGVQKLLRDGQDCEKVVQQLTAARKALDRAFYEMMACLIETCVLEDKDGDADSRIGEVRSLLSRYS